MAPTTATVVCLVLAVASCHAFAPRSHHHHPQSLRVLARARAAPVTTPESSEVEAPPTQVVVEAPEAQASVDTTESDLDDMELLDLPQQLADRTSTGEWAMAVTREEVDEENEKLLAQARAAKAPTDDSKTMVDRPITTGLIGLSGTAMFSLFGPLPGVVAILVLVAFANASFREGLECVFQGRETTEEFRMSIIALVGLLLVAVVGEASIPVVKSFAVKVT